MLPEVDHENYNCIVTDSTGKQLKVYANWLHNNQLDQWEGWACTAGSQRLYIDAELNVYSSECQNDLLGHIDDWKLLEKPTTCKRKTCTGCTDDLITTKWKLDN